jgi:predicted nucleotidyltransferase
MSDKKRDDILKKVKSTVLRMEPSAEVILYGSRVRDDYSEYSDWDFLVLVDGEVNSERTDRIRHALYEIEWESGEVISSIIRNRKDWNSPKYKVIPLHSAVELEGVRI